MQLFEIYLSPLDAKRFLAIATRSEAGDGQAESSLPFWASEQDWRTTVIKTLELSQGFRPDYFPQPAEQAWMQQVKILTPDAKSLHPAYLAHIGQALYEALFPAGSSLRQAFQTALRLAEQAETGLQLRLKFAANSAQRSRLADYPWELIHDGQRFLEHRQVVVSRYIAYEAVPPKIAQQQQLKVLLLSPRAADPAQGMQPLSSAEQLAVGVGLASAEAAGAIVLERLTLVTRQSLSVYFTQQRPEQLPQVLHFDGHGLFGKRCMNLACRQMHAGIKVDICQHCGQQLPQAQGFLVFDDGKGGADYVSATALAALLPRGLALVVLSACQSGMAVAGESVFNGAAQQLIDSRVPAVVAMQYKVQAADASQFAEQFYRVLGAQRSLLEALHEGRKWMDVDGNQWYRPVLYLRWPDNKGGQLFSAEPAPKHRPLALSPLQSPMMLSPSERLQLIQRLNGLPPAQFAELVSALNPPAGIVPPESAAQGNRTPALLQWAEGPTGRGLLELQTLLDLLMPTAPTAPPPTPRATSGSGDLRRSQQLELQRLETELADHDQDYKSVQDQLRVELDGPTRNRLNRQLEQIRKAMDKCEHELQQLRQSDGP